MYFWPPKVYIMYFGEHSAEKTLNEIEDIHHSYLLFVKKNEVEARASLIYNYKQSINGFAAMLTPEEASKLSSNKQKHHMGLFPIINLCFLFISNIETMVLNIIEGSSIGISKQPKKLFFEHYKVMGVFSLRTGRDKTNKG